MRLMTDAPTHQLLDDTQTLAPAAHAPCVLALDIGTSSVRASVYDAAGDEVAGTQARVARDFRTTADGGAELDAEVALAETACVVDETLARAETLGLRITAIGVSCFWHSLVGVDESGRALTPVYGWADTRAAAEVEALRRRFNEPATHRRTGCRFHASYWPAKLLWLRRAQPGVWHRVAVWLSFGELLARRVCGTRAASLSMASGTGLLDQRRCAWDDELLEGLGLHRARLAPLAFDATENAPPMINDEFAARWPQLRGCPWFAAIGDGAANNVGANCVTCNEVALMVGTSGALRVFYEGEPPAELPSGLWCYRVDKRRVIVGGALSDGGGLYAWLKDSLAVAGDDDHIERELAALAPDAHGLTLLPFWAGERSTNWNAHATGAILGLTTHSRPAHVLRAALEAVAYRFAFIWQQLAPYAAPGAEVRASGGALIHSTLWTQIIADALNRPVRLAPAHEASSRGAALLALEALGVLASLHQAPDPAARSFAPDAARHALYRAGLERQETIYQALLALPHIAQTLDDAPTNDER